MDYKQDLLQSSLGGHNIELERLPPEVSILVVETVDVDAGLAVSVLSADSGVIVKVAPDRPSALHLLANSHVHLILLGVVWFMATSVLCGAATSMLALVVALGVWAWMALHPSPEKLIRRQLAGVARAASS